MSFDTFIISWRGYNLKAANIAREFTSIAKTVNVIYSTEDEVSTAIDQDPRVQWVKVPDTYFFGRKLSTCFSLAHEPHSLFICADAEYGQWANVGHAFLDAIKAFHDLGVWAPSIDHTPWTLDLVEHVNLSARYSRVLQTDGVVWGLCQELVARLKVFDYSTNNSGWNIDWAAICIAYERELPVIRDKSIKIFHPTGTGYNKQVARLEGEVFLRQFSDEMFKTYASFRKIINSRHIDRQTNIQTNNYLDVYKALSRLNDDSIVLFTSGMPEVCPSKESLILRNIRKRLPLLLQLLAESQGKERKFYIFGTGVHTRIIVALFPDLYKFIDGFIDSYKTIDVYLYKPCLRPESLELGSDDIVLYSSYESESTMNRALARFSCTHFKVHEPCERFEVKC